MDNKLDLVKINVSDNEWVVLYKNGINYWEGDSLDIDEILDYLVGYEIKSFSSYYIDLGTLEDEYGTDFPLKLSSIKQEHLR